MESRNLTLTLVSANGLKKSRFTTKMDVYAVAFISGTVDRDQKQRTNTVKHGDSDPTWNFHMKFVIDEAAGVNNGLMLVVKIKAEGMFGGKNLGEVHVPVKELLEGVKDNGKAVQTVSYQVKRPSGKPKGALSFMYEFGERFAYPTRGMGMSSREQPAGDGYQNQQPGHVYYPPPPRPVVPLRRCSSMGML